MKKYTKFIAIFLLINIISNVAYAGTIDTSFNEETYAITISGIDHAESNVMLQVLNPDVQQSDITGVDKDNFKDLFSNVFETQTDTKGGFTTPTYTPQKNGSYSIRLKCGNAAPVLYEDAFFYLTKDYVNNVLLPNVNSAGAQAVQYIADSAALACGFDSNYKHLSGEYLQKAAECAIAERELASPQKFDSREAFETVMKASIMINLMENHKANAADVFNHYAKDAALQNKYSPLSLCDDYVSDESITKIVSTAINGNDYTTISSFMKAVGEKLILKALSEVGVYMNVETILTQNEHFFDLDLDDYKKIKDKSSVNEAIAKSSPQNIAQLKTIIKTEAQKHSGDGDISYGGNTGSSPGKVSSPSGGGGNVSVSITPAVPTVDEPVNSSPFVDIDDVTWAVTAIDTLHAKGIINGTSSTHYSPMNNVTREEFIKLLSAAFVPQLSVADIEFSDVTPNDWFYPYIADAYSRGLVKGTTPSAFGAGLPITRQDMAVMAYRYALAFGNPNAFVSSKRFSDSHTISDYAKEATEKLAGASVISGTGSGSFEPLVCCNRAQAAVIVYNLIKFMKGD